MKERAAAFVGSLGVSNYNQQISLDELLYLCDGEVVFPQLPHPDHLQRKEADVAEYRGKQ